MGYDGHIILSRGTSIKRIRELLELLDYHSLLENKKRTQKSYVWYEKKDYKSYSGVLLNIDILNDIPQIYSWKKTIINNVLAFDKRIYIQKP